MEKRRRLLRRRLRSRVALLLSFLCLLFWGIGVWGAVQYSRQSYSISLGGGQVRFHQFHSAWFSNPVPAGWHVGSHRSFSYSAFNDEIRRLVFNVLPEGYSTTHPHLVRSDAWRRLYRDLGLRWPVFERRKDNFGALFDSQLVIPIWIFVLPVWLTTFILIFRDSRRSADCCDACGYCLRGVESGVCPECGERMPGQLQDQVDSLERGNRQPCRSG